MRICVCCCFFFQAEDGIRDLVRSRGLGDVYKRQNIIIETGRLFDQPAQILHIDRLCNECGNCARFCLWKGEPYKHKPTLFDTLDDLRVSNNAGFAFFGNVKRPSLVFRAKVGDAIAELPFSAWNGVISLSVHRAILALARVIWSEHRYLVEVHE